MHDFWLQLWPVVRLIRARGVKMDIKREKLSGTSRACNAQDEVAR